ncbi:MAG TPA: FlgD immunoglobulin-like domain containing protein [Candidatus Krumholzibacteria bacterium]|nr:FlgD immunoglobulin-like domain containing protein [Candidatus Krumholzibacteria bacterium]
MTLGRTARRPHLVPALAALLIAITFVVAPAPVTAHEGRSAEAASVLARVDGEDRAPTPTIVTAGTALRADDGHALRLVDLGDVRAPATAIDFELASTRSLRLEVLDLEGNLVRTLARGTWAEGSHQLAWHHDADDGQTLDHGLFLVRIVAEGTPSGLAAAR